VDQVAEGNDLRRYSEFQRAPANTISHEFRILLEFFFSKRKKERKKESKKLIKIK